MLTPIRSSIACGPIWLGRNTDSGDGRILRPAIETAVERAKTKQSSNENGRRDAESFRKCPCLPSIDLALAAQNLADIRLGSKELGQIGLPQVVLLHEKSKHRRRLRVRDIHITFFVVAHEYGHDVEQAHQRVHFPIADLIDKLIHEIEHCPTM